MNPGEYDAMARVEEAHWWYRGLRDCYRKILERPEFRASPGCRILDVGCGTGENLRCLAELLHPSHAEGFDPSDDALQWARRKAPDALIYRGDLCAPELQSDGFDLVVSLDVIYIPGVERALQGLRTIVGAMRSGGLFIVNLPAYDWLYSEHDVAIHTSERYTASRVQTLFDRLGLRVERLSYRLCFLFPAIVLSRLPGKLRAKPGDERARSDLHELPGAWTNHLFLPTLRAENRWIASGGRLPWGSSVFAVGRKP
jgi:SAM-dependent methyltransferase